MSEARKINKLLVANRGEIAIRVLRAASELKIRTVAIFTYEDRYSLHRYKADEAYMIGNEDAPLKPYLDIEEIVQLAKKHGVDAIHPGYGFLSENVRFAARCREVGVIFIGPDPEIMDQLGDKEKAKKVAVSVDVSIIESNKEELNAVETALAQAGKIGYPCMLKAVSGGGGRGMRVVRNDDDLKVAFTEARSEALNAFGDDSVFLEKLIEDPKHLEVQLLGDRHGNLLHLYERDCSVQRRFQKVVEVAPSQGLKKETREKLYAYALKIGNAVGYNNAGTVEFLVDPDERIYFIEVNPRIQVEHTVTEEITGIDIVRCQILIASGHRLDSSGIFLDSQESVQCNGFALQCRITKEDPKENFKPDYGTLIAYRNATGFGIRIDEGSSYSGVRISPFFDSMLAKVTASGRTLVGACQRLHRTLTEYRIRGVKTNIRFLEQVIQHEDFQAGKATVNFIANNPQLLDYRVAQDRGTKILKYLANVSVNGNPDVKAIDETRTFRVPKVPEFDRFAPHEDGTKQLLEKLGPEGFSSWLKSEKEIKYTDTTFRDAHQSLIATRVRTKDLMQVAEGFSKNHSQLFSMEVWGGATFDVAMRFLKECPWDRLRQLRKAIPNVLLQMLLRASNAVGYKAYPDNLVERFIVKSAETGIDVFRIFDSLNWIENMKVSINVVREQTNSLAEACLCYTGDILDKNKTKYTLEYYLDLAKQLEDAGAHILAIKDMAGLLRPYAAEELISALKKTVDLPIHLHTHDTSAAQLATYIKAVEAGVDVVDVALSSMSGLTSQPNFNTMVEILRNTDRAGEFDVQSLNAYADYWEAVREYYYPFESGLMSGTAEVYKHEIPGGQYSNLGPQARSLGLGDRMTEIKKAYGEVNELFGNVVKVTPSSKVVGDMALYMVSNNLTKESILNGEGNVSFPDSVKSFFLGELGQPHGGFPSDLQKMVLKEEAPFTDRPNVHLNPIDFEAEMKSFKRKFGKHVSELDLISYLLYPSVFEDYWNHLEEYGNVSVVPTLEFFFGMENNQDTLIQIDSGKSLIVHLLYIRQPNEDGYRTVHFRLNGQSRSIEIKDRSIVVEKEVHEKVTEEGDVGVPLQGLLSKVLVKKGDEVKRNDPLFVIEAMKMETTISASEDGVVDQIILKSGTMVDVDDLVLRVSS